jgi:hypothetical protein
MQKKDKFQIIESSKTLKNIDLRSENPISNVCGRI